MNLLFDLTPAARPALTGVGVYAVHLAKEIAKSPLVHCIGTYKISRWKRSKFISQHINIPLIPEIPIFPEILAPQSQIYHGTDFRIPRYSSIQKVVTVHDLVVFQNGFNDAHFAEKSQRNFLHMMHQCQPHHIITVSHSVAQELKTLCPQYHNKITTVHSGINHLNPVARKPSQHPIILFIGTKERRKNLIRIIQAFEQILPLWPQAELILAGGNGNGAEEINQAITNSPARKQIKDLGFITNQERNVLLSQATVFVYASLYEGFGLPILEAMRASCPVITSNHGAQAEIAGQAALLVQATDVSDIAEKINEVISSPSLQAQLSQSGLQHSQQFTWKNCAEETVAVYKKLISK